MVDHGQALNVRNQSPLRAGVPVDVALGRLDGAMASEQLHVAQAAAGAMDVAGGDGDETAPARIDFDRASCCERARKAQTITGAGPGTRIRA
jgi:hypothetical protein